MPSILIQINFAPKMLFYQNGLLIKFYIILGLLNAYLFARESFDLNVLNYIIKNINKN